MRFLSSVLFLFCAGCTCFVPSGAETKCSQCSTEGSSPTIAKNTLRSKEHFDGPSARVRTLSVCNGEGQFPLDAAREAFDAKDYDKALSCAAQAAALTPGDVLAHTERANALAQLSRNEEATLAYARALAIAPESLEALAGAAHFFVVLMPSSREMDELGSTYAERGFELASAAHDEPFTLTFARLSAMALNDTGQAQDALERADWVLQRQKNDPEASYERAVALYELCRFSEAKLAFTAMLTDSERAAWAHHHLGLLLEREGNEQAAEAEFTKARALDTEAFPVPVLLTREAFQAELTSALADLPDDMRRDLKDVPVEMEDLPEEDDLTKGDLPLSPSILGLFRGTPLKEPCEIEPDARPGRPCRTIALYRKNLARAVKSKEELLEQIRVTLLHEIGHLRGEDDSELAARGLE